MKLTFLGGTGTVTGSKYLLENNGFKILIDCGLFQGLKELRLRNWDNFPIDPSTINAVIVTHAHIDHTGYLPVLMKKGFSGPIYSTEATFDLCKVLLRDAGKLQEEDAEYANKKGFSKHTPAEPLFTIEDAEKVLNQFKPQNFHTSFELNSTQINFIPSGHILGSAFVRLKIQDKTILFTGDLGRPEDLIMNPPEAVSATDYLIIESTYGNRTHEKIDPLIKLEEVLNRAVDRNGVVMIPAFSIGRTQAFLYAIHLLKAQKKLKDVPVFLNSPMSISAMEIYCKHRSEHRLNPDECHHMCATAKYVRQVDESIKLNSKKGPMIIISASGMATGGRILHHFKAFGPDKNNMIVLAGFQAAGTRGRFLLEGKRTMKIHGKETTINAEVELVDGFSAHADQNELIDWLKNFSSSPKKIFVTHGEPEASLSLKNKIQSEFNWNAIVPEYLQTVDL